MLFLFLFIAPLKLIIVIHVIGAQCIFCFLLAKFSTFCFVTQNSLCLSKVASSELEKNRVPVTFVFQRNNEQFFFLVYVLHITCMCVYSCVCVLSCVQLFLNPWTVAHQAPLSIGIFQARMLEWVSVSYSRVSSRPKDRTPVSFISYTGRQILYHKHYLGKPHILHGKC